MAESLKERQARMAEKLKTEAPKTPLQEVNPVTEAESNKTTQNNPVAADGSELVQLNCKVSKRMLKGVRQSALDQDKEIRDVVREALEEYLAKRVK